MSKQKLSLQEQLLQSGLVNSAKAKSVKTEQRKKTQQQRKNNAAAEDAAKDLAKQAQAAKAEKDRLLNQQRTQQEAGKQLTAQIKQLVESNRIAEAPDGEPYHFTDNNKVKTLYVSESLREQLGAGRLAIVKSEQQYAVVPLDTAEKIRLRSAEHLVLLNSPPDSHNHHNDPYAAFPVPDDLMW